MCKKPFAWLLAGLLVAVLPFAAEAGKKDKKKDKDEEEQKWDVSNPPGEWETIVIDTTETTWSDVDVSPDGSTVIFGDARFWNELSLGPQGRILVSRYADAAGGGGAVLTGRQM